jgi:hypothetical protein
MQQERLQVQQEGRDDARTIHNVLNLFNINSGDKQIMRESLHTKLHEAVKGNLEKAELHQRHITETQKKIDKLTERELFERFESQFKAELEKSRVNLQSTQIDLSNLEKQVEKYLQLADNLGVVWQNRTAEAKSQLQNFVFPKGIRYDLKNNQHRTVRVNAVYAWIALASGSMEKKETGLSIDCIEKSGLVAPSGLKHAFIIVY